MKRLWVTGLAALLSLSVQAAEERSRIIATGGASTIEGSAGGGIVPMAVLSGYGAREEQGGAAFASTVNVPDFELFSVGGSWSFRNRVEVSVARQTLRHNALSGALGVSDTTIEQTVAGVKVRLAGDLLYTTLPQISLGAQYKKNHDFLIPSAVGAQRDSDTDYYASASKVLLGGFFGYNWLLNATARYTRANQTGLVGFGGDLNDSREWQGEVSTGVFYNKHWLVGAEYRQKPDNLSAIEENDWHTAFVAFFPNKDWAVVGGYADLGSVATFDDQAGWYLSVQGSF